MVRILTMAMAVAGVATEEVAGVAIEAVTGVAMVAVTGVAMVAVTGVATVAVTGLAMVAVAVEATVVVIGQQGKTIASSVAAQAIGLETANKKVVAVVHVHYPPLLDQGLVEVVHVRIVMAVTVGIRMINTTEAIMLIRSAMIAKMIDMEAVIDLPMTGTLLVVIVSRTISMGFLTDMVRTVQAKRGVSTGM